MLRQLKNKQNDRGTRRQLIQQFTSTFKKNDLNVEIMECIISAVYKQVVL